MTRVGFYVVQSDSASACHHVAAVLAEKALRQGHRIYVLARDKHHAQELHDTFWSFRPDAFLPASLSEDRRTAAIVIGHTHPTPEHHDCLINLSLKTDNFASRFKRIVEIVTQQASHLDAMRDAWRWYKHRGFTLEKHDVALPDHV
jgi:DNA polymerase-3 subunit chi